MPLSRWSKGLTLLLAIHIAWGLARLPGKVVARRLADVRDYEQQGPTTFHFANNGLEGAAILDWLRANTEANTVVAWRGTETQVMEFAAGLLWPRLLVRADALDAATAFAGRTIAVGSYEARQGRLVLVAVNTQLRLEVQ